MVIGGAIPPVPTIRKETVKYRLLKLKTVEYKGGCCSICGYDKCADALAFHHCDPKMKEFRIGGSRKSWNNIRREADKCILLCANCHVELHDEIRKNKTVNK